MAISRLIITKFGVTLLVAGGAFLLPQSDANAQENAATKPKTIRLGVDPDQYLRNRHKRVRFARQQANSRAQQVTPEREIPPVGGAYGGKYGGGPVAAKPQTVDPLNLPSELADRPGFNEFSYLSETQKEHAKEIMQFLKDYQAQGH